MWARHDGPDSIYTERYMLDPANNPQGYAASSVVTLLSHFDLQVLPYASNVNASFLLLHGVADDNVHFMNSAIL